MTTGLPWHAQPPLASDPTSVGPYRVLGRIAQGPAGPVLLSRAVGGAWVALHLPDPATVQGTWPEPAAREQAKKRLRARFTAVAEHAAAAAHPALCAVLDVGVIGDGSVGDGLPYLVTEYVDGPTLAQEVAERGPLSSTELNRVAVTLLDLLASPAGADIRAGVQSAPAAEEIVLSLAGPRVVSLGLTSRPPDGKAAADPAGTAWARVVAFASTGQLAPPGWPRRSAAVAGTRRRGSPAVDRTTAAVLDALPHGRARTAMRAAVAGAPWLPDVAAPAEQPRALAAGIARPAPPRPGWPFRSVRTAEAVRTTKAALAAEPARTAEPARAAEPALVDGRRPRPAARWRPVSAAALCAVTAVAVAAVAGPSAGPITATAAARTTAVLPEPAAADRPAPPLPERPRRGATPRPAAEEAEVPGAGTAVAPGSSASMPPTGATEATEPALPAQLPQAPPRVAAAAEVAPGPQAPRPRPARVPQHAVRPAPDARPVPGAAAVAQPAPPAPPPPAAAAGTGPAGAAVTPAAPNPPPPAPGPTSGLTPVQISVVPLAPR
ncbi:hypothetical protein CC117_17965 [Parafrankia colletiae]|uniref:Protein kinase domain-containing protein n=1 Tax=Parafrankia colletiae TaxID=573497 RepID=A0A1S1QSM8_9ACTN|nr:hypothetical protein [Parafrankia colletiae]MCK9901435.1 hypothetical protein [Frankia sp. Cpl3]OHV36285.1 hypothetical protein CC117_17965 [Parafrankia colletiae]